MFFADRASNGDGIAMPMMAIGTMRPKVSSWSQPSGVLVSPAPTMERSASGRSLPRSARESSMKVYMTPMRTPMVENMTAATTQKGLVFGDDLAPGRDTRAAPVILAISRRVTGLARRRSATEPAASPRVRSRRLKPMAAIAAEATMPAARTARCPS